VGQVQEERGIEVKSEKLPRGIRRRGDALVVSFALADGSIERRSVGTVSVSYAIEQRAIFQRQVRENCYEPKRPRVKEVKQTIADLWEMYLRAYKLAGKKAAWRQEMGWVHLKPKFATVRPDELTTAALTAYQEARQAEGAAAATVNRELSALSAALFNAAQMTVAGGKPLLAHVPIFPSKLKEAAARKGFLTQKQYTALAVNAKALWMRTLIACAYSFGFRKSELLNLRVRQVDFLGRWLELEQGTTKNDEGRKVKMTGEVFELMRACTRDKKPNDFVFTREDGEHVVDPRDDWYALCVASGVGQLVPAKRKNGKEYQRYVGLNLHDFRRSAIRNLMRHGVSQTVAMRISGHKTASVFRRYDIVDEQDLADATQKIELGRQVAAAEKTEPSQSDGTGTGTGTSTKTDTLAF
jgi:integrase